jgi:ATP-dependent DNA helicase RecG
MIDNILQGESKTIEYKQSYTQSLLKTVSAYANFNDGVVLIGVTDNIDVIGAVSNNKDKLNDIIKDISLANCKMKLN